MLNNTLEDISYWWRFSIRPIFYNIKYGIKNLIRWFPIIWKDRDWDYAFIYDLLSAKLKFQANSFKKHGVSVSSGRDAEVMILCSKLIAIVSREEYETEYFDYRGDEEKYFKKNVHAYNVVTKTNRYYFDNDTNEHIAMNIGQYKHRKAKRLLFKIIEDRIDGWWD